MLPTCANQPFISYKFGVAGSTGGSPPSWSLLLRGHHGMGGWFARAFFRVMGRRKVLLSPPGFIIFKLCLLLSPGELLSANLRLLNLCDAKPGHLGSSTAGFSEIWDTASFRTLVGRTDCDSFRSFSGLVKSSAFKTTKDQRDNDTGKELTNSLLGLIRVFW